MINESEDGPDYYRVFPHFHIGHHACLAKNASQRHLAISIQKCIKTPSGGAAHSLLLPIECKAKGGVAPACPLALEF